MTCFKSKADPEILDLHGPYGPRATLRLSVVISMKLSIYTPEVWS